MMSDYLHNLTNLFWSVLSSHDLAQLFWFFLTFVALAWYSSVTIYVAIRGIWDIKSMLKNLAEEKVAESESKK